MTEQEKIQELIKKIEHLEKINEETFDLIIQLVKNKKSEV
jgi:hypothetical protein